MRRLHLVAMVLLALVGISCGGASGGGPDDLQPDASEAGADTFRDDTSAPDTTDSAPIVHDDFAKPVIDPGAPAEAPSFFGVPDKAKTGPCLYEPEIGSLFPHNWLRPRFRYTPSAGENVFEIKLVIPYEKNPLVVYTSKTSWTMDKGTWDIVSNVGVGGPIHVTVRSATYAGGALTAGPFLGTEGDIEVAPVDVPGSIVYWTTSSGTVLKGFQVGDETVQDVLRPKQAATDCIACHSSTPDGKFVAFIARDPPGTVGALLTDRVDLRSVDGTASRPTWLTPSSLKLLARNAQEAPVFSKSHWTTGDRIALSAYIDVSEDKGEIIWTDLEATSEAKGVGWGVLARTGDSRTPALPQFSHDGKRIVYFNGPTVSWCSTTSGGDLWTVPYGDRKGGTAAPLAGASDPTMSEFFPTFSPDDKYIAFNRVGGSESSYSNPNSEVWMVPSGGGTATRLAANDPPACTGKKSPGSMNSWSRWAPEVKSADGRDYYFLVFSSTRNPTSAGGMQLYVAPVVVSGGTIKSYAALYFWNQPEGEHNHTPAWDVIKLPGPK